MLTANGVPRRVSHLISGTGPSRSFALRVSVWRWPLEDGFRCVFQGMGKKPVRNFTSVTFSRGRAGPVGLGKGLHGDLLRAWGTPGPT